MMSLFGSSPEEEAPINSAASKSRNSLFTDEPNQDSVSRSLFADDGAEDEWGVPTPKKSGRGEHVGGLLEGSEVPDFYIDTFDDLLKSDGVGGKISPSGVTKILSGSNLDSYSETQISNLISSGGQLRDLNRNEFNVLLALIGLAQEHEDITLDGVDERRQSRCLFDRGCTYFS